MVESSTEMAPLLIVPPNCVARAKAAPVQVWEPAGRKTMWLPLLVIPLTVMMVRELYTMMLGVRVTLGGAGGGEGGGGEGGGATEAAAEAAAAKAAAAAAARAEAKAAVARAAAAVRAKAAAAMAGVAVRARAAVARAEAAGAAAAATAAKVGVPSKLRLSQRRQWGSLARSRRWLGPRHRHRHCSQGILCSR